ncbi:Naphthalene 1,2-dioxygenase system ferredoxin subunit [Polystyrenella longa]|uniref:Naphthalene 1,2-dioxygenase system ferredoxin subunit n=1 Tax=Polystyrenella longa TaxID=2528007 RepID=A0A518CL08_9PLAN|nr:Rieske 2Fe-2S domain-containing protein [Polystyrenella longa]QDU79912.1 Naphthalene 1,2-dioxygenase system ferredoxin subunit [Polystyrenella longa]
METSRIKLCSKDEIPAGGGREFTVADRIIAVFEQGGEYFALDGICPHAGGPLGAGQLTGTTVTCPWHGWQFDVTNGQHGLTPNICQETFPVSIEGVDLYIDLPPCA